MIKFIMYLFALYVGYTESVDADWAGTIFCYFVALTIFIEMSVNRIIDSKKEY